MTCINATAAIHLIAIVHPTLITAAALMMQRGPRCCTEMKDEMPRIYNASQITDKEA